MAPHKIHELGEGLHRLIPKERAELGSPADPDGKDTPFDLRQGDDDVEQLPARGGTLGAVGQLIAAFVIAALLGVLIVGAVAVLSWLFA